MAPIAIPAGIRSPAARFPPGSASQRDPPSFVSVRAAFTESGGWTSIRYRHREALPSLEVARGTLPARPLAIERLKPGDPKLGQLLDQPVSALALGRTAPDLRLAPALHALEPFDLGAGGLEARQPEPGER